MTERGVVTVVLVEAALFLVALAVFGALVAVLRTRAAVRNRQGNAEGKIRDEAATAERVNRRLAELTPSQQGPGPRAASALGAPATTPRAVAVSGRRRPRGGPVALAAAGILAALVVAVLTPHAAPGGVLGVRGVPATSTPPGPGGRASAGSPSLLSALSPMRAGSTPAAATQTLAPTPINSPPSPTPTSSSAVAPAGTTGQTTVSLCDATHCVVYVVRSGDTVAGIARRFGVSVAAILAVNPQLRDPNLIVTGQTLLLPSTTP